MSEKENVGSRESSEDAPAWQTFVFFSIVLVLSGIGAYLLADYLWGLGWTFSSGLLWFLFVVLFAFLSFGFTHALTGFLLRRLRLPFGRMIEPPRQVDPEEVARTSRVAVIIPVYNEPVDRVFAGIRAIYESLMQQPGSEAFDFFVLSDSNQPQQWVSEEAAWVKIQRDLNARDRIFYRRRPDNVGKKSGNVSDFCRTWGNHYRYMVVLDADSIMSGRTLVELLRRMEANPHVGLIQTAPGIVGGESLFGRMQQFANRLYGAVFMEGLCFWQQNGGNFWGHNAIIRVRPFVEHCDLPQLPGKKPFGGHILSHDFVEAALLRKAGWEVWLATDLDGSYEEGPQSLVDFALRDRRWCQGNLQHGMVLFARGFRGKSRIHIVNGILGYVSSPIWLLFMAVAFWRAFSLGPESFIGASGSVQGIAVLGLTMILLFGPKLLCLLDLAFDRERARGFGGMLNAITSSIVETFFSALIAPVMMLFHTKFVVWNLVGRTVGWSAQRRGALGTSWDEAIAVHGLQTLFGIGIGIAAAMLEPILFWWLSPVLVGLWLSIPISVWTSRPDIGANAKREELFQTPEETLPPTEVTAALTTGDDIEFARYDGVTSAVLDPFLNAVHVSLLRRNRRRLVSGQKVYGKEVATKVPMTGSSLDRRNLAERLLHKGPKALDNEETLAVLSDIDNMLWIHREAWLRPGDDLAPWWRKAIREMSAAV